MTLPPQVKDGSIHGIYTIHFCGYMYMFSVSWIRIPPTCRAVSFSLTGLGVYPFLTCMYIHVRVYTCVRDCTLYMQMYVQLYTCV